MKDDPPFFSKVMILGGPGLVGRQIVLELFRRQLAEHFVICALTDEEARDGKDFFLAQDLPDEIMTFETGDIFAPTSLAKLPRSEIEKSAEHRQAVLDGIFGKIEDVWERNHLAILIDRHRPDALVDCVNTATGISYRDSWDGVARVRQDLEAESGFGQGSDSRRELETLMMSEALPQLVRHVVILEKATRLAGTKIYLKIGTTGTGGMGLNIPYTHSEGRPSRVLMGKTGLGFAQTGLLALWGRTPDGPIVKEIKPAAMLGFTDIKHGKPLPRKRIIGGHKSLASFRVYEPQQELLQDSLDVAKPPEGYASLGEMEITTIATGENGSFTVGEFTAITAVDQMEMATAEEVAQTAVLELIGRQTGREVIAGIDATVLPPTFRAGFIRQRAIERATQLANENDDFSIALGLLGPPELSKLLFEAQLFLLCLEECDEKDRNPEKVQSWLIGFVKESPIGQRLVQQAISIGVPVLLTDNQLIRGPWINIPEPDGHQQVFGLNEDNVNIWAGQGWIDLRLENVETWIERIDRFGQKNGNGGGGSDSILNSITLSPGEIVAWIFNNEQGGGRIKH